MGISGLLPLLKSIQKPCHLKKFSGQTIGVDAYGWLHRGTVSCAIDLALGKPCTKFVDFAMHRVRMLLHFNITPYIVFDGDYLPSKSNTEAERRSRRAESKKLGLDLLDLGKTSQAHLELQKAVDVTPEMARQLIEELKKSGVSYVVAPYEADSQLVYLERKGLIQGIISEDSDMLVFGAKCLLTKLDQYGECVMVHRRDFAACRGVSLVGWTDADFRRMAILSGCDYLPSINNMGLKTAYRLLRKYKNVDRLVKQLQWDGKWKVPKSYLDDFEKAELTFLYQWVWCPENRRLVNLMEPPEELDIAAMGYIGSLVEPTVAMQVAVGDIHPHTKKAIVLDPVLLKNSKWPAARQTVPTPATPADCLKKNKGIDTFFKPTRVPLAELDPNSFTPSPSQQRLLQREQSSWTATPAPIRPPAQRRNFHDVNAARTSVGRTFSAPNPCKRQRLCSDDFPPSHSSTKVVTGASRFFSSPGLSTTPSARPSKSRSKSAVDAEFQLWSDDSIEEALADFADTVTAAATGKKKLEIFRDDSGYSTSSQLARPDETPRAVTSTKPPEVRHTTIEHSSTFKDFLNADLAELRTQFSYQIAAASEPSKAVLGDKCTAQTEDISASPTTQKNTQARPVETEAAEAEDSEIPESEVDKTSPGKSDLDGSTLIDHDTVQSPIKLISKVIMAGKDESKARQEDDLAKTELGMAGSEDMLIPDSEAESEPDALSPVSQGTLKVAGSLNLGRFAFAG